MGFALTILYIIVTIVSPEQFGKEWASYHAVMYLAGITALASLPSMATYSYWKTSIQTYLLIGFTVAIALSQVAHGWLGGVVESWRMFLPSAAVFFFIVVNVTTVRKLGSSRILCGGYCGSAVRILRGLSRRDVRSTDQYFVSAGRCDWAIDANSRRRLLE
jgi:hypothetical protein